MWSCPLPTGPFGPLWSRLGFGGVVFHRLWRCDALGSRRGRLACSFSRLRRVGRTARSDVARPTHLLRLVGPSRPTHLLRLVGRGASDLLMGTLRVLGLACRRGWWWLGGLFFVAFRGLLGGFVLRHDAVCVACCVLVPGLPNEARVVCRWFIWCFLLAAHPLTAPDFVGLRARLDAVGFAAVGRSPAYYARLRRASCGGSTLDGAFRSRFRSGAGAGLPCQVGAILRPECEAFTPSSSFYLPLADQS